MKKRIIRKESVFLLLVVVATISGAITGLWLNPSFNTGVNLSQDMHFYLRLPGTLFLRLMRLLVVPLAMSANIDSFSSLKMVQSGKISATTMIIFCISSLIAATSGACMTLFFRHAYNDSQLQLFVEEWANSSNQTFTKSAETDVTMLGLAMNLIPDSVIESSFRKSSVIRDPDSDRIMIMSSDASGANLIGILLFSIVFGIIVGIYRPATDGVADFFHGCRVVFVNICAAFIWTFPVGVFSMVAHNVASTGDLIRSVAHLSLFTAGITSTFVLHIALLLIIFTLVTKRYPTVMLRDMFSSLMCATATASSAATMPLTLKCMGRVSYANPTVVRFVLPLGCTLNMNGTSIFQSAASLFLLQCAGTPVQVYHVIVCIFCSILASAITGALPSGSLLSIVITLDALQVPIEFVQLLLPIDWLLDRMRTPTNVLGNAVTVVLVTKIVGPEKYKSDSQFVLRRKSAPALFM